MFLWSFCALLFLYGASRVFSLLKGSKLLQANEDLQPALFWLHEIQESLQAGLLPRPELWQQLETIPQPWRAVILPSLSALREQGAPILSTVARLRALLIGQTRRRQEAQSQSAQARFQAWISLLMVPLIGITLYGMLPALQESLVLWLSVGVLALLFCGVGSFWMLSLAQAATWGNLRAEQRSYPLLLQCAGEYLLAQIRAGLSADQAWQKTYYWIYNQEKILAWIWGASFWSAGSASGDDGEESKFKKIPEILTKLCLEMRRSVQVSVMEGLPCGERLETSLKTMDQELQSSIEQQLVLLPTRCLKPLFLMVAPSVLGMMFCGIFLGALYGENSGGLY